MRKIDWLNHFLEFIVVIIGILLAFQLQTCSENDRQLALVDEHLMAIKDETRLNASNLEASIATASKNLAQIDSILMLLPQGELEQVNRLSFSILSLGNMYFRKNAYTTFKESGDIRFLKDYDSKKRIIDLYEYYVWTESIQKINMDAYEKDYLPYVKSHLDMVGGSVQDASVYQSQTFTNALATYRYTMNMKLTKLRECQEVVKKYLAWTE